MSNRYPIVRQRTRAGIIGLQVSIVAAVVVPALIFGLVVWTDHVNTMQAARARVARLAQVAEEHAARVLQTSDVIAELVLKQLGDDDDARVRARESALHEGLRELATKAPQMQSMWVWSSEGRPLASSRFLPVPPALDVSDREYFRALRDGPSSFYISPRLISRTTGEPFVDFARRRTLPGGRFGGVVSISISPRAVQAFYATLTEEEPGLAIALVRREGEILVRWPQREQPERLPSGGGALQAVARGERIGAFDGPSALDGIDRSVAYRALNDYPVLVVVGLPRSVALAPWWRRTAMLGALLSGISAALVTIGLVALRRTVRALRTEEALEREAAERGKAETALRSAQKLEALGQLTSAVAHDFNNLLSVVANNAHVRARLDPDFERSAQAQAILRAVRNGAMLTRQLLTFSRERAGQSEPISLQHYLPELKGLLETTAGSQVRVTIDVDPSTPGITVDSSEFELAILNLALNARHAMPNGGHLSLAAQPCAAREGLRVQISMSDTGHGIAPDVLPRMFEPFFSTRPPGEGTGLGLSQVRQFCRRSGGDVSVASEPGQGARFEMVLPAGERALRDAPTPPAVATPLQGHVGYVEDNVDLAAATRALLEASGCTVTHHRLASDLHAQLEQAGRYDVIVTDVSMPSGIDGVTLALAVRERWPALPVLLMSGYSDRVGAATDAGFTVLQKPVSPEQLVATLRQLLGPRQTPQVAAVLQSAASVR